MYVTLVQYSNLVPCVVAGSNVIPSLVVSKLAPQEVLPPIQDGSGDVTEWAHKGSRWFCKVDACTNSYVAKWLLHQHLEQTHSLRM
jgi:hypothetical protein